jgi:hypothetical protein
MVAQVRRRFGHAPRVARGAYAPAFAGEGHQKVVSAVATESAGKAVGKDAAFQILLERFAHKGLGGVVVALAVELARAGQLKPGLVVLGYRLVQQRALGVARVVELGFDCRRGLRSSTRAVARMIVRVASSLEPCCRRVHGASP